MIKILSNLRAHIIIASRHILLLPLNKSSSIVSRIYKPKKRLKITDMNRTKNKLDLLSRNKSHILNLKHCIHRFVRVNIFTIITYTSNEVKRYMHECWYEIFLACNTNVV